ncbi:MAG: hypothetical protein CL666_04670 [Balneola sp.]|nr:hypothetical protein [Balneola sp.]|tara:strand:+ start:42947 stop:43177 length:231 start_codon:yes stop_codon:yes gene_type:complete
MIIEKTMYTVKCDGCGKEAGENEAIVAWQEEWYAEEEAIDSFGWIEITDSKEQKHYCPDCCEYDENNDCKRPKARR